jgi:stress-induced-phosphoprotein 1
VAYLKLLEPNQALLSVTRALELDATYAKAHAVKGDCHYLMKEYHKAIDAFEAAKKIEPGNERAAQGHAKTMMAIQSSNSNQPDQERLEHAMADPEIQNILRDPQINQVLRDMQENPAAAQGALNDPKVRNAINKLIAAGVIKVG